MILTQFTPMFKNDLLMVTGEDIQIIVAQQHMVQMAAEELQPVVYL